MFAGRVLWCLLFAALALALGGCGRSSSQPDPHALTPESQGDSLPDGFTAIPPLASLPYPSRSVATLGPGWAAIAPQETVLSGNATLGPGAALTLNAATGLAYAVYGIAGFDGDNGPTSARITQSSLIGQYFIGFSDYVTGSWRFAGPFTGSATVEIPLPDGGGSSEYMSPRAFTSAAGTCYFVVVVPLGGLLQLTGTELGVHGGTLGPEPTTFDGIGGGANGCLLHWRPSPSCKDADFAGYLLESAPLLSGSFYPLHPGLLTADYFLDTTGVLDTNYRYRLAAVDASGNKSIWTNATGGAHTGSQANPIPVLKLPRGPLYSPAQVTLDMSESTDPEGVGITDYAFQFLLYPDNFNGADPTPTVTLPPGCHAITATVTTGDGRTQSTMAYLKIYPRWATAPTTIATPDPAATVPRMSSMRAALLPGTTRPVMFGSEHATYSSSFWFQKAGGSTGVRRLPLLDPVVSTGEPVVVQESVLVPVNSGMVFMVARFNGVEASWIRPGIAKQGSSAIAAVATPANRVFVLVLQDHGGSFDLTAFDLLNTSTYDVVVANIGNLISVDAAYHPATDEIDIAYSTGAATEWVRWDPATNTVTDSSNLAGVPSGRIDVERNPATGEPGVARFDTVAMRWIFTERDSGGIWLAPEIIDNSGNNGISGDMAYDDTGTPYAYFATAPGQPNLHERTGVATWGPRNTPAYAAPAGVDAALVNLPGTNEFLAADRTNTGRIYLGRLTGTPSETIVIELAPFQGLLMNIHGAAGTVDTTETGSEELHVMFNAYSSPSCYHYTSINGGLGWAPRSTQTFSNFDMGATKDGGIYVTNRNPPNHELHFWDFVPDVFLLYATAPTGGAQFSFLKCGIFSSDLTWTSHDGAATLTYTTGHFGVVPTTVSQTADINPVWAGAGDVSGYFGAYGVLAGGADMNEAQFHWGPTTSGALSYISDSLAVNLLEAYDESAVRIKQVAATTYLSIHTGLAVGVPDFSLWSTYGPLFDAERYTISLATGDTGANLPLNYMSADDEPRRSVSAACGAGFTGIGLLSVLDGSEAYFEWSNYGNWERLPLPAAIAGGANHELIIGRDGNWHIVYWDWVTDRVLCLNSL